MAARLRLALLALTVLLAAGYIGVDVVLSLPRFLFYENIVYAVVYAVLGFLLVRGWRVAPVYAAVAGFNAGRVSRTIVTPEGGLGALALQHVPLLALLLAAVILSVLLAYREMRQGL